MSPTSTRPNRSSLSTTRVRGRNRNLPVYSATSRRAEVYLYTGRKSIPFVTNLISRSWKERSGFVGSFQVVRFDFLTFLPTVGRNKEAPHGFGQTIRRTDACEPCRSQGLRTTSEGGLREILLPGRDPVPKPPTIIRKPDLLCQLEVPKVQYEYFDFHTECGHMKWDRISVLLDKIKDDLEVQG